VHSSAKLAGFAVGLVAVFGGAYGVGSLVGPLDATERVPAHDGNNRHTVTDQSHGSPGGHGTRRSGP
jgi:hypothetical protein